MVQALPECTVPAPLPRSCFWLTCRVDGTGGQRGSTSSVLPGHLNSETISADGSGLGCHLGWTHSGVCIVWTNGAETPADMSLHTFYTSSSHIWLLFLPMASGVCASGAKSWLCSAVAPNHESLSGCDPVPELAEDSVPVWPSVAGITTPVSCEKTAAILLYPAAVLLLPSPLTSPSGSGWCQGYISFAHEKLS